MLSWNGSVNYLVASGADDGSFRIWDLRHLSAGAPVAHFHWHKQAITSIEWAPHESSSLSHNPSMTYLACVFTLMFARLPTFPEPPLSGMPSTLPVTLSKFFDPSTR